MPTRSAGSTTKVRGTSSGNPTEERIAARIRTARRNQSASVQVIRRTAKTLRVLGRGIKGTYTAGRDLPETYRNQKLQRMDRREAKAATRATVRARRPGKTRGLSGGGWEVQPAFLRRASVDHAEAKQALRQQKKAAKKAVKQQAAERKAAPRPATPPAASRPAPSGLDVTRLPRRSDLAPAPRRPATPPPPPARPRTTPSLPTTYTRKRRTLVANNTYGRRVSFTQVAMQADVTEYVTHGGDNTVEGLMGSLTRMGMSWRIGITAASDAILAHVGPDKRKHRESMVPNQALHAFQGRMDNAGSIIANACTELAKALDMEQEALVAMLAKEFMAGVLSAAAAKAATAR